MKSSNIYCGLPSFSPRPSPSSTRTSCSRAERPAVLGISLGIGIGVGPAFSLLAALALLAGCDSIGNALCDTDGCQFSDEEWSRLSSFSPLGTPPPDPSNRYVGNAAAEALGQRFYFDSDFSGVSTLEDSLRRPRAFGRAPLGAPVAVACATCHDPALGGTDHTSRPNHVSIGAGWYDVNSQPSRNAAFYDIFYWNARTDSLWLQAMQVTESRFSMNGSRIGVARAIYERYAEEYAAVFGAPLPDFGETRAQLRARLDEQGECRRDSSGACPAGCVVKRDVNDQDRCVPRWPLEGAPDADPACRLFASPTRRDEFDCLDDRDKALINRTFVNYGKAIAAYEYRLYDRDSPFDRFVREGPDSKAISDAAIRGARLFVGRAACIDCHSGPLFSDQSFHNIGVPQAGDAVPTVIDCSGVVPKTICDCTEGATPGRCPPFGVEDGLARLKRTTFTRTSTWSDDRSDTSRQHFYDRTLDGSLRGAWRTPSLRNVAVTAPYMHNGYYATLEAVVRHYNEGRAFSDAVGQKSVRIQPLHLTPEEEADLVEFLKTLTGDPLPEELVTVP